MERTLERTPGIFEHHSLDIWKQPGEVAVVDYLQAEKNVRVHDAGGAGRGQFERVAVLLSRCNRALRGFPLIRLPSTMKPEP